jgi:hypothetical protein
MKLYVLLLTGMSGLLLGSATPPSPTPSLAVDPSVFGAAYGCPDGAGDGCVLLADGGGGIVLAGLPRPPVVAVDDALQLPTFVLPAMPPAALLRVVISLPQQKAYVFRDRSLVATSPVSTGRPGHPTPLGTFRITQKKVRHRSNIYSNAPMPFMQRLTDYGIALHAGHLPGYPASHGCIRLPWSFARRLYGMTDFSTRVTVTRARPRSARDALKLA